MRIKLLTRTMLTLSIAVMAILGKAHAGTSLPKEIVGMWCYYSPGENADARSYLRNDASAPKPDTPCMKGGNTEWIGRRQRLPRAGVRMQSGRGNCHRPWGGHKR